LKKSLLVFIVGLCVLCIAGLPLTSQSAEKKASATAKGKAVEGKAEKEKAVAQKAVLRTGLIVGTKVSLELANSVPVRGVQCTLSGIKITEVRTTARTAGFLAKFNEANGTIIIISTTADEIAPGAGAVAEVICEKAPGSELKLSDIKLASRERTPL